jgi:mono/diheme cytochrome c family protein
MAICAVALLGCEKSPPTQFRLNAVEWLKLEKMNGEKLDQGYKREIGDLLTALFGTPDDPDFPFLQGEEDPAHDIISLDNLKLAAGPVKSDKKGAPSGLYREHCAHCHGVTGDGAGPTAAILNPYPRDFRLGKFKFKSTPLRVPPTNHDLKTILKEGIPGTAMPSFRTLPDEELDALIDYVKYLTMRGMFERFLLAELPGLDGASYIDFSLISESKEGEEPSEDDVEEFEEQIYATVGTGFQEDILDRWLNPDKKVTKIPPAPAEIDPTNPSHERLVLEGRELFYGKGNCAQCHGQTGYGDGQASSFDDWTNEWYTPETHDDFVAIGALPARPIRPRNLHQPVYRGGDRPSDIYLRVANGIEGTPMPASAALSDREKWAIVAFIRSLPFEQAVDQSAKPVNEKQVAR